MPETPQQLNSFQAATSTSGLVMLLSENPNKFWDKLHLIIQKKKIGNVSNKFDDEYFAICDKLIKYEVFTSNQQ